MESVKKFFMDVVLGTGLKIHYGIRDILKKAGMLDSLELFVQQNIEDPLVFQWFKNSYDIELINDGVIPSKDQGTCVIASNHHSLIDPLTTGLAIIHNSGRMPKILTKIELRDDPILGAFCTLNQAIYVKRGEHDLDAIKECVRVIEEENRLVLVYPEGTFGPGKGEFLKFKSGAARIAWDAQVDVIPLAQYGDDVIVPKADVKNWVKKGPKMAMAFGERIRLEELFPGKRKGDKIELEDFNKASLLIQDRVKGLWDTLNHEFNNYDEYETYYDLHPEKL